MKKLENCTAGKKSCILFAVSSHTVSGPRQSGTIQKFVKLQVSGRKSTQGFLVKLFGGQPISPLPPKASQFKVKSELGKNIYWLVGLRGETSWAVTVSPVQQLHCRHLPVLAERGGWGGEDSRKPRTIPSCHLHTQPSFCHVSCFRRRWTRRRANLCCVVTPREKCAIARQTGSGWCQRLTAN